MARRVLIALAALFALALMVLQLLGSGVLFSAWGAGTPTPSAIPSAVTANRSAAQAAAANAAGVHEPKQILFGDLHVHTTYSTDAFLMSLPLAGGDGARPVSDACDFARYCSALDFWSINDHALALTPRRWRETVQAIRECNEVSGDLENPDVTAFLGWEWTQVGSTPDNHYGHKNVILKHLDDDRIPRRPISAGLPRGGSRDGPPSVVLGLIPILQPESGPALVKYFREMIAAPSCEEGVPVRELPDDCIERAATPEELFEKLDDWGHDALVIPHGTTWGYYTPLGSAWDKQLTPSMHDPMRQKLVEVYSGHGNSEEFRSWREVIFEPDGRRTCPAPTESYLPSCWQAGEIILERCLATGESVAECDERAAIARDYYLAGDNAGQHSVPGQVPSDWGDSGQCRDCFLPAFNYRPRSSVQYMLTLSGTPEPTDATLGPLRFRFGFLASSDNHSARPGTGYKEYDRRDMTEMRFASLTGTLLGATDERAPAPEAAPVVDLNPQQFFGILETERQASFFLTGGLVAVHSNGRSRDAIFGALERREVYGTSGPRTLLWFDLMNPPGTQGGELPMGSEVQMAGNPIFRVRATGSLEQEPGCPDYAEAALSPEHLARLCAGECYYPSDRRRQITRIEVVRIRPRASGDEAPSALIDDPWRVYRCDEDPTGCRVTFSDPDFSSDARDTVYYVRAIEAPSAAVNARPLDCQDVPLSDDCSSEIEERAWSSPIFVDYLERDRSSRSEL